MGNANDDERNELRVSLERFAQDSAKFNDIGGDIAVAARRAYIRAKHDEHKSPDEIAVAMRKALDDLRD